MKGHVLKRGKTWCIVYYAKDKYGQNKQVWKSGFPNKKKAEKELTLIVAKIEQGLYIEPEKQSIDSYLDFWLANYAETSVNNCTYRSYVSVLQNHIRPLLGPIPICDLKPIQIQSLYTEKLQSGLSPKTVHNIHRVLSESLEHATLWQIIISNPCRSVHLPKYIRKEMNTLNSSQLKQLFKKISNEYLALPVHLAVYTGMRRGEIIGLKWNDVDFTQRKIAIRRGAEQVNGMIVDKNTKTYKERTVFFSEITSEFLMAWQLRQEQNKVLLGADYIQSDYVCVWENGRRMPPHYLTGRFLTISRSLGFNIRFHDLRHTNATLLLQAGVHPKIVSQMLGHSTINITMDIYSHALPEMQSDAADKLSSILSQDVY